MASRLEINNRKQALEQSIRSACLEGRWSPGSIVPPVRELAERHGLSISVVNQQLQKLVNEGVLYTVPRVGTFVSEGDGNIVRRVTTRGFLSDTVVILRHVRTADTPPEEHPTGWLDSICQGATEEIHRQGLHALSLHLDRLYYRGVVREEVERLCAQTPYGILVSDLKRPEHETREIIDAFRDCGANVVVYGDFEDYDRVMSDHAQGCYELTRWLISLGKQRIVPAWEGPSEKYWLKLRYSGYERAMCEAGLEPRPIHWLPISGEGDSTSTAIARRARRMLEPLEKVLDGLESADALMATSDGAFFDMALACRTLGVSLASEVLLVGYDNYWRDSPAFKEAPFIPAASVDKRNWEIGRELVRLLADRQSGALPSGAQCRWVEPSLVVSEELAGQLRPARTAG
jgi:DNA-binding LacI/PurR family transcriptional regulator